jgi:HD-like signal output (HDOD) protein
VDDRRAPAVFDRIKSLAPFPPAAARLTALLFNDEVNFQRVAAVIETDAALVVEVLRLANSPLIGLSRSVATTLQALALLGVRRVYALIITLTLCRFLRAGVDAHPAMRACWRHNLATALLAKQIGLKRHADPDYAYLAGLLHEVGKLALLTAFPRQYNQMFEAMASGKEQRPCRDVEREWFGVDHCEAGQWLLEAWNLPAMLCEVTRTYDSEQRRSNSLAAIVGAACLAAARLGFASGAAPARSNEIDELPQEWTEQIVDAVNHLECEYGLTSFTAQPAQRRSA